MQRKKLISKTLTTAVMLALYIGVAQPSITSAQEYTDQIKWNVGMRWTF